MGGWLGVAIIAVLVALAVLLPPVLLAARRRWLAREGGTFECSLRLRSAEPSGGWVLGVGRYNDERLEWFRFFSFSFRPVQSFVRSAVSVLDVREPDAVEAASLFDGQVIVRLQGADQPAPSDSFIPTETPPSTDVQITQWQLAMEPESLTGMLSWLEAAPPGGTRY
jgi:hypothetical protein